jgi:hypothetical protein
MVEFHDEALYRDFENEIMIGKLREKYDNDIESYYVKSLILLKIIMPFSEAQLFSFSIEPLRWMLKHRHEFPKNVAINLEFLLTIQKYLSYLEHAHLNYPASFTQLTEIEDEINSAIKINIELWNMRQQQYRRQSQIQSRQKQSLQLSQAS